MLDDVNMKSMGAVIRLLCIPTYINQIDSMMI